MTAVFKASESRAFLAAGRKICRKEEKLNAFGDILTRDHLIKHSLIL